MHVISTFIDEYLILFLYTSIDDLSIMNLYSPIIEK